MLIKIINTYHNTETLCEFDSLEEAIKDQEGGLEFTAHNLVENDGLEDDWEYYYDTEEEAFQASFDIVFEQLKSEVLYEVVEDFEQLKSKVLYETMKD